MAGSFLLQARFPWPQHASQFDFLAERKENSFSTWTISIHFPILGHQCQYIHALKLDEVTEAKKSFQDKYAAATGVGDFLNFGAEVGMKKPHHKLIFWGIFWGLCPQINYVPTQISYWNPLFKKPSFLVIPPWIGWLEDLRLRLKSCEKFHTKFSRKVCIKPSRRMKTLSFYRTM